MSHAPQQPGPDPDPERRPESSHSEEHDSRINPARLEVRVRRIALLLLVAVPLIYFIVHSLR